MEHGSIEREIHIDASPEIVFEVISSPEHIRGWWNGAETEVLPTAGSVAEIAWGKGTTDPHVEELTVVDAQPPHRFSFRWVYGGADAAAADNSLLVIFELTPSGAGTLLRLTETGFREKGWDEAVREAMYADHINGWDIFIPSIAAYVSQLVSTR